MRNKRFLFLNLVLAVVYSWVYLAPVPVVAQAGDSLSLSTPNPYINGVATSYVGSTPYAHYWTINYRVNSSSGAKQVTLSTDNCPQNATCRFTNDTNNQFTSGGHSFTQTINANTNYTVRYEIKYSEAMSEGMSLVNFSLSSSGLSTATKLGGLYIMPRNTNLNVSANFVIYGRIGQPAPAPRYFTVYNTGIKTINWSVTPDQAWCTVTKLDGSAASGDTLLPGQSIGLKVSVDLPSNHAVGNYTCKLNGGTTTPGAYAFLFSTGAGTVVYSVFNTPSIWGSRMDQCGGFSLNWQSIAQDGATYTVYRNRNSSNSSTAQVIASGLSVTSYFDNSGLLYPRSSGSYSSYYYWVESSLGGGKQRLNNRDTNSSNLSYPFECGAVSYILRSGTSTFSVDGVSYTNDLGGNVTNVGFQPIVVSSSMDFPNRCFAYNEPPSGLTLQPGESHSSSIAQYPIFKSMPIQQWCSLTMAANTGDSGTYTQYAYVTPIRVDDNLANPSGQAFVWDNSVCNQIIVKWKGANDATGYNIYRAPYVIGSNNYKVYDDSSTFTFLGYVVADPYSQDHLYTYVDSSVAANQPYVYRIVTADSPASWEPNSSSDVSVLYPNGISATTTCSSPPSADLKVNNSDGPVIVDYNATAEISWTSSNAANCTASGSWSGSKSLSGLENQDNVTTQKTYTLTCANASGQEATDSIVVNVRPQAPQNVDASNTACEQITLTWDAVSGASGYNVYRNTTSNLPALPIASNISETLYADALASGQYYYWVSALNAYGESPKTAIASGSVFAPSCEAALSNSDLDIVSVNNSSLPTDVQNPDCNGPYGFNISPANKSDFKSGDIVTFEANICNDQGQALAQNVVYTAFLTNLAEPESGWNARIDGSQSEDPTVLNSTVSPNQTLQFNIGNVPKNQVKKLLFDAKIALPLASAYELAFSRFTQRGTIAFNQPGGEAEQINITSGIMLFSNTQGQPSKVELAP